jgi:hypothetical protein
VEQPKINVQNAPIIDLKKPLVKKNKQTKQGRDKCGHTFFYLARIPQMVSSNSTFLETVE